jgi:hypothetical protein
MVVEINTDKGENNLVFALKGGRIDLDPSKAQKASFTVKSFNLRNGNLIPADTGKIIDDSKISFDAPDGDCRILWLSKSD